MANTANITCRAVAATVAAQSVRLNTEKIEIGCCRVLQNPAEVRALDPTSSVSSGGPRSSRPAGAQISDTDLGSAVQRRSNMIKQAHLWKAFGKSLEGLWKV